MRPRRPAWSPASGTASRADSGSGGDGTWSSPGDSVPVADQIIQQFSKLTKLVQEVQGWALFPIPLKQR